MPRAAQKSERGSNDSTKLDSTSQDKSGATASDPSAKTVQQTNAVEAGAAKSETDLAGFQSSQFESLRTILDKRSGESASPSGIAAEFAGLWLPIHAADIELLVPALRQADADESKSSAARIRKDILNIVLADLIRGDDSEDASSAKLEALSDAFDAYQKAAEQEREGLGENEGDLGRRVKDRFDRLKGRFLDLDEALGEAMDLLAPRSLSVFPSRRRSRREYDMVRSSSNTSDRDDQGRFVSDNDRGYSRGRGGPDRDEYGRFASEGRSSRSRYEDDDKRSRGRDESGRFMSERSRYDDDDNGSRGRSMSRGRDDDYESDRRYSSRSRDDDDRRGGRSHGGWFGDSEGHSEASRRGWQRSDHGESGWFGDREGHSEASRRGWQRSDHGDSGWYGDSEGHSEAARRGWEDGHRSQRGDDDDGSRGSRRNDDEYRRDDDDHRSSSRSGGHGGRSGDPEGHSEASRRGWENRR